MNSESKPTFSPLTCEQLMEALQFFFSRGFGISSEAMFREAMGLRQMRVWGTGEPRPWDAGDSEGVEETYSLAPDWLKERMLPRLTWYREIAALGWPDEAPSRKVAA